MYNHNIEKYYAELIRLNEVVLQLQKALEDHINNHWYERSCYG